MGPRRERLTLSACASVSQKGTAPFLISESGRRDGLRRDMAAFTLCACLSQNAAPSPLPPLLMAARLLRPPVVKLTITGRVCVNP